jgi:hypothetical protein
MSEKEDRAKATALPNSYQPWVCKYKPPLFWEPTTDHPISAKLANMKAAIAAGADVNELDKAPDPRRNYGRPLHFASDCRLNFKYLKENLPLIKLLLESGADPRLPGMMYTDSALEEVKGSLKWALRDERFQPEWKEIIPFLRGAYKLMKEAADRLDGMFLSPSRCWMDF